MRTIHTELGIGAPAPVVWQVLTDFKGWERWNPFMRISGSLSEGAHLDIVLSPPGQKPRHLSPKVVTLDDGRELRWQAPVLPLGLVGGEHGFRVVPEDVGRCRFEQFESFRGLLSGFFFGRMQKTLETGFQAMNRMLKREAERVAREQA